MYIRVGVFACKASINTLHIHLHTLVHTFTCILRNLPCRFEGPRRLLSLCVALPPIPLLRPVLFRCILAWPCFVCVCCRACLCVRLCVWPVLLVIRARPEGEGRWGEASLFESPFACASGPESGLLLLSKSGTRLLPLADTPPASFPLSPVVVTAVVLSLSAFGPASSVALPRAGRRAVWLPP